MNPFIIFSLTEPKDHLNFIGGTAVEPVVVSVQFDKSLSELKVLIRTRKVILFQSSFIYRSFQSDFHTTLPQSTSKNKIVSKLQDMLPGVKLKEVTNLNIRRDLVHLEVSIFMKNY